MVGSLTFFFSFFFSAERLMIDTALGMKFNFVTLSVSRVFSRVLHLQSLFVKVFKFSKMSSLQSEFAYIERIPLKQFK